MTAKSFKIAMTGDKALDAALRDIASENGAGSVNKEMRSTTRQAIREIVLPEVRSEVPAESGLLESELTVKAIARSRQKMGTAVGFRDDLFQGDTFYGGFLEFGFVHRAGTLVFGESFLRGPLYRNESKIRSFVMRRLRAWVKSRRRK
ncbi:MAG: hypothetical protein AAGG48_14505 [Planctomycetota bacterium]